MIVCTAIIPSSYFFINIQLYWAFQSYFSTYFHFPVLPGSLDRLVQITGTVPNTVAQAKVLMEDTIRRKQWPLPDGDTHSNR